MGDWAGDWAEGWAGDETVVGVEVGAEARVLIYYEEIVVLASRQSWRKRKKRRWM